MVLGVWWACQAVLCRATLKCRFPAGDMDHSTVLLGMLVAQDVQLGLFIAVMPTLMQAGAATSSR